MRQAFRRRLERLEEARGSPDGDPPPTEEEIRNESRFQEYFWSYRPFSPKPSYRQWWEEKYPRDPYPREAEDKQDAEDKAKAANLTPEERNEWVYAQMRKGLDRIGKKPYGRS